MQIEYELSFEDYAAAQKLHAQRSTGSYFVYLLNHGLLAILGIVFFFCGILLLVTKVDSSSTWILLLCGGYLALYPIYQRRRLKRCYKRTRSDSGARKVTLEPDRIQFEGTASKGEFAWKAVKQLRENDAVFLLYTAPARFMVLPKRICTAAQIEDLKALFAQCISPPANV